MLNNNSSRGFSFRKNIKRILSFVLSFVILLSICVPVFATANAAEYANISGVYMHTSGVGGWSLQVTIDTDGNFTGSYVNSDYGIQEKEYPNGTIYQSEFKGRLNDLSKKNQYTFSAKIIEHTYTSPIGEVKIIDGIRYVNEEIGFGKVGDTVLIYTSDAPVNKLPKEFIEWIEMPNGKITTSNLGYKGIYVSGMGYFQTGDYQSNNSNDTEMMEYAEKLWDKQYKMIFAFSAGKAFKSGFDTDEQPVKYDGTPLTTSDDWSIEGNEPWYKVYDDKVRNLSELKEHWLTYFTDDFAPESWYTDNYRDINGELFVNTGGIGGDWTLTYHFLKITEQKWNKITFLVQENYQEWSYSSATTRELYYTIVFEDKEWKCSEAVYADGTTFMEKWFGVDSDIRTIDFGNNIKLDLKWGWTLFDKNASEYDHNLAMAGLVLSRAAYDGKDTVLDRLEDLEFESVIGYNFESNARFENPAFAVGSQKVTIGDETKIVIAVVTRGTTLGTGDGWTDIIDGCGGGFSTSAANTLKDLESALSIIEKKHGYKLSKENTIFFLTGHSLGGAVSGVLSNSLLNRAERENIFTYTFGSPNYYTVDNCESYKNNHNILNTSDGIRNIPWLKKRYGNDWYYDEKDIKNTAKEIYVKTGDKGAHDTETYLACLLSGLPKNMGDEVESIYNLSSIYCPVDITVYDENGTEMGHTTDSKVTLSKDSEVLIYTDGDSKFVISPPDKKYTIKFTATDDGTMTFIPSRIETVSRTAISEKEFSNVKLTKGKVMIAEIGGDAETDDIRLFVQNENGKNVAEILPDGSEKEMKSLFGNDGLSVGVIVIISIFALLLVAGGIIVVVFASKRKNEDIENIQDDNEEQLQEMVAEDNFIVTNSNDMDAAIKILNGTMSGFTLQIKDGDTLYLGKDPAKANIIFSNDYKNVSRIHCSVFYDKNTNKYFVIDCSSNGTYFENHNRFVKGKRTCVNRNTVILLANDDCSVLLK